MKKIINPGIRGIIYSGLEPMILMGFSVVSCKTWSLWVYFGSRVRGTQKRVSKDKTREREKEKKWVLQTRDCKEDKRDKYAQIWDRE